AETKRVADRKVDLLLSGLIRNVIEITLGIRRLIMNGGWQNPIAHRLNTKDRLQSTRRAHHMPRHGFRGRYWNLISLFTKCSLNGSCLRLIIQLGPGPVGVYITQIIDISL